MSKPYSAWILDSVAQPQAAWADSTPSPFFFVSPGASFEAKSESDINGMSLLSTTTSPIASRNNPEGQVSLNDDTTETSPDEQTLPIGCGELVSYCNMIILDIGVWVDTFY